MTKTKELLSIALTVCTITAQIAACAAETNNGNPAPLYLGQLVDAKNAIEVVAQLREFSESAGVADMSEITLVFDISTFVIIEPSIHRGKIFTVQFFSGSSSLAAWREVGKTYEMLVHRDILLGRNGEEFYGGPQYVSIVREIDK